MAGAKITPSSRKLPNVGRLCKSAIPFSPKSVIDRESPNQIAEEAMRLRAWRNSKNLTLQQAAPIFGMAVSSLSDLERSETAPSPETIARILGATGGAVTAADLFETWHLEHRTISAKHREAGRSAMLAFQSAAKKPRK